jgi:hypothetical protein
MITLRGRTYTTTEYFSCGSPGAIPTTYNNGDVVEILGGNIVWGDVEFKLGRVRVVRVSSLPSPQHARRELGTSDVAGANH